MYMRTRSWLVVLLGMLAVSSISCSSCRRKGAAREDLAIVPQEAQVIVTLNVSRVRDTAMWRKLIEFRDQSADTKKQLDEFTARCGFDPFKHLESAMIAFPTAVADGEVGIIIHGTFDEAKIMACAKQEMEKQGQKLVAIEYGGKKLYSDAAEGGKLGIALLDPRTLIIGGKDWPKKMIDLSTGKQGAKSVIGNPEIASLVKKVKTTDAIWAVALIPENIRQKLAEVPMLAATKSLKDIYASFDFATGVRFNTVFDLGTEADAKELVAKVNEQLSEAKKNPQIMMLGLSSMFDALKVNSQGSAFKFDVSYNQQQVEQLIERLQGALKTAGVK